MVRVVVVVDAEASALGRAAGTLERTVAVDAHEPGVAWAVAVAAVLGVLLGIDADPVALLASAVGAGQRAAALDAHQPGVAGLVARAAVFRIVFGGDACVAALRRTAEALDAAHARATELTGPTDLAALAAVFRIELGVRADVAAKLAARTHAA